MSAAPASHTHAHIAAARALSVTQRIQPSDSAGVTLLRVLYAPVGLVLLLVRLVLLLVCVLCLVIVSLVTSSPDARSAVLSAFLPLLGIIVTLTPDSDRNRSAGRLFVCNNISPLDDVAWQVVKPSIVLRGPTVHAEGVGDSVLRALKYGPKEESVCVFAEGIRVPNQSAVLQFTDKVFGLEFPVFPVALRIDRPSWLGVSVEVTGSRDSISKLWFLAVPYTVFTFAVLSSDLVLEADTAQAQAQAAQRAVAAHLHVPASHLTAADLPSYVPPPPRSRPPSVPGSPATNPRNTHLQPPHSPSPLSQNANPNLSPRSSHTEPSSPRRLRPESLTRSRDNSPRHSTSSDWESEPAAGSQTPKSDEKGGSTETQQGQGGSNTEISQKDNLSKPRDKGKEKVEEVDMRLEGMVEQVMAVFPDMDRRAVWGDLTHTENVNTTIERVLAGLVKPSVLPPVENPPIYDETGRALSLSERKAILLSRCKRRYLERTQLSGR